MTAPADRPRLTVVSSFPETGDTYPQVAAVARILRRAFEVTWAKIEERGLFFDALVERTLLSAHVGRSLSAAGRLGRDWLAVREAARGADVVVAIDFMAFACACSATRAPVVLWSLDYISDDESRHGRKINRLWLEAIRRGLRRNPNVIIQDEARFVSFARSMRLAAGDLSKHDLPVALPPAPGTQAASEWSGRPHVMQIGGIGISRSYSDFLVERFRAGGDFDLSFHGRVHDDMRAPLESVRGQVRVSAEMVEPEVVPDIVRACSVGFIGNRFDHEQFRLLKHACGQLVEYLRRGKPVICMGPNDLGPYVEAEGVGVSAATAEEFDSGLRRIHADYAAHSRRALALFEAKYDLGRYEHPLCEYLAGKALTAGRRAGAPRAWPASFVGGDRLPALGEPR